MEPGKTEAGPVGGDDPDEYGRRRRAADAPTASGGAVAAGHEHAGVALRAADNAGLRDAGDDR